MDYFRKLMDLLQKEKEAERGFYARMNETMPLIERRAGGVSWYPIVIKDTEAGLGDYLTVECERPAHQEIIHQFRFGMSVALFSNHDAKHDRVEGVISYLSGNRMKINMRVDELPDWARDGKLGIDAIFDSNSFEEMEKALRLAPMLSEKKEEGRLVRVLTGVQEPAFSGDRVPFVTEKLNASQQLAVSKILMADDLAIVHGPPGTGKTTTLVQAIKAIKNNVKGRILAVAPSNTAVDLLTEKLSDAGLNVIRVGNPARVSERLMSLTLDSKVNTHPSNREIKKLKRQASEFRDMAHKYKRSFGKSERDQRKALFTEAQKISKEVERTEQYIVDDLITKADVITATLVGSNHYSVRALRYHTVVIDEAGQALEPACWVAILKGRKLILAGDHQQLPPVIKSEDHQPDGLENTLLEKMVHCYPNAVVLLEEQYRMNTAIMQYSSKVFYDEKLFAHASVYGHLVFSGDEPLIFIDTAGCGYEEVKEGTSTTNPEEGNFLLKHLSDYLLQVPEGETPSVAVISPYKRQVEVLKDQVQSFPVLMEKGKSVAINTIDSFQGQERDIVYISLTRSNQENIIGFLSETRRMNVAMTRARKKLVVIGDSATISGHPFYREFIEYAQGIDAYHSAWEFAGL